MMSILFTSSPARSTAMQKFRVPLHIALAASSIMLAASGQLSAQVVSQQAAGPAKDSVGSIMRFVKDQKPVSDIVEAVNIDCFTFPFELLSQTVRETGLGYENLTERLKRRCALMRIETDPPGATLKIAGRELGTVSPSGDTWWVEPGSVVVSVSMGTKSVAKTFDVQANNVVQAKFQLPKDTLPWPTVRGIREVAR